MITYSKKENNMSKFLKSFLIASICIFASSAVFAEEAASAVMNEPEHKEASAEMKTADSEADNHKEKSQKKSKKSHKKNYKKSKKSSDANKKADDAHDHDHDSNSDSLEKEKAE